MRPQSIIMFERLFLASLAFSVLSLFLSYQQVADLVANDPGMAQLGLGSGFVIGIVAVVYAVDLLLWYLIAHRASNAAKWILVVFTVIGVLFALPGFAGPWNATLALSLVSYALGILAVVYLFRSDATAWLGRKEQADPATFD